MSKTATIQINMGNAAFDGDDAADLLDPSIAKRAKAERAMDKVREKLGRDAVVKGRGFESEG